MSVITPVSFNSLCSQGLVGWDWNSWEELREKMLSENRWSLTDVYQLKRECFGYLLEKWLSPQDVWAKRLQHLLISWKQRVTDKIHSWVRLSLCSGTCQSFFPLSLFWSFFKDNGPIVSRYWKSSPYLCIKPTENSFSSNAVFRDVVTHAQLQLQRTEAVRATLLCTPLKTPVNCHKP